VLSKLKALFNKSWSIFLARLEVFTGFILGVIALIDWSSLATIDFDAGFSNTQMFWFAIGLVIKGIISEVGRRAGTTPVNNQLVPTNIAEELKK